MLRIGLIGLGRHGFRYARHLARGDVKNATVSAVWRRDEAKGRADAAAFGARYEASPEAVIDAPDVDAVAIVVPVALHAQLALQVAKARKPLLLEKPMARNVAEGSELVRAFQVAQRPLMVAQTLRFDPLTLMLRDRARALGELRGFRFEQRMEPRGLPWEDDPVLAAGGVLIQTGIHTLDALRFSTGAEQIRVLNASIGRIHYRRSEDHALVTLAIDDRVLGDVGVSKIGRWRHMRFALFCEQAVIEADYIARKLSIVRLGEREAIDVPEQPTVAGALDAFARCVAGEAPNAIPGDDALASLALVEAAYQAAGGVIG